MFVDEATREPRRGTNQDRYPYPLEESMNQLLLTFALLFQQQASWALQDQFGKMHTPQELQGRVVLLVGGDRAGSEASARWVRATMAALGKSVDASRVTIIRVADLRQVPVIPQPFAQAKLPSLDNAPVLLDFQGVLARRYGFEPGSSNQLVIGTDGKVLAQTRGNGVNAVQASILAARIREAIERAPKR